MGLVEEDEGEECESYALLLRQHVQECSQRALAGNTEDPYPVQRKHGGKREADGVNDKMRKAPVGIEDSEVDLHVVAEGAQVLLELEMNIVRGVIEGKVGDVCSYGLAGAVVVVAAQRVSGGIG